ncbi:ATP-binding protein [Streptomyces sp. NPDC050636]|uniref:ATP-binding protein n=1 Tax=Streptomyces sp. NPDC050636 TaxID=3154510 RepID=UPI003449A94B
MTARQLKFSVPGTTLGAARARRRVVAQLRGWGMRAGSDLLDTVELVAGELIANAVRHAREGAIAVGLRLDDRSVRVEVFDSSRQPPRLCLPGTGDENGRGLLLVAALAERHDVEATPSGKRCWAEIAIAAPAVTDVKTPSARLAAHVPLPRS